MNIALYSLVLILGLVGVAAYVRIGTLEKELKRRGVISDDFDSEL